jgi:hypothetical protein
MPLAMAMVLLVLLEMVAVWTVMVVLVVAMTVRVFIAMVVMEAAAVIIEVNIMLHVAFYFSKHFFACFFHSTKEREQNSESEDMGFSCTYHLLVV